MTEEELKALFTKELELYACIDEKINIYAANFDASLFIEIKQLEQEITTISQQQIEAMKLLHQDETFRMAHPLWLTFTRDSIDFSRIAGADTLYLCYVSIYKLLQKPTGQRLISTLYHHLSAQKQQKIVMYPSQNKSIYVEKFDFYHPTLEDMTQLRAAASESSTLVSLIPFIAFAHELVHILHDLLKVNFKAISNLDSKTKRADALSLAKPKYWLYVSSFSDPKRSYRFNEYITIEGRQDTFHGLSENAIRFDFGRLPRASWKTTALVDPQELKKFLFFTQKNTITVQEQCGLMLGTLLN